MLRISINITITYKNPRAKLLDNKLQDRSLKTVFALKFKFIDMHAVELT